MRHLRRDLELGNTPFDISGRHPGRPLFLASNARDTPEGQSVFANSHAVADRLAVGEYVVEIAQSLKSTTIEPGASER